ncbi:MAG TPA: UV DNA damage repair endonuclease UvsE [Gemmatimonadaceae bacterium]|nr:UV DNA damage repair endonuclease UvsE [Gemmatimonadaceae bacterium]
MSTLGANERRAYLSNVVRSNGEALAAAVERCSDLGIGAFRVSSQIMPLATHPVSGYDLGDLDDGDAIVETYRRAGAIARERNVRLSFHPDQFVVLNSESERVVEASLHEMRHQGAMAELIGAEALTLHVGGRAGGVQEALARFESAIARLAEPARSLIALENDDRLFSPAFLLPFCERLGIPFIYDVHHHRCNPDDISVSEATQRAIGTWRGREPWMHISSPKDGWIATNPRMHAGFIDPSDIPDEWSSIRMTVDVEAKEKERAVLAIMNTVATPKD